MLREGARSTEIEGALSVRLNPARREGDESPSLRNLLRTLERHDMLCEGGEAFGVIVNVGESPYSVSHEPLDSRVASADDRRSHFGVGQLHAVQAVQTVLNTFSILRKYHPTGGRRASQ